MRATRGWSRGSPPTSWPHGCSTARPRPSTWAARPRRHARFTASTNPPPPTSAGGACSPAGCWSAACGSSRSGAAQGGPRTTGTTTATSPRSCRPSRGRWTGPTAALLRDLKARGLLEDTLVVWSTEFGRQPFTQGADRPRPQRRHLGRLAGRRGRQGRLRPRRERPLGLESRRGPDVLLRPARDDPAPAGDRPHATHVPAQRHRPPAHRRAWACRQGGPGLTEPVTDFRRTEFIPFGLKPGNGMNSVLRIRAVIN